MNYRKLNLAVMGISLIALAMSIANPVFIGAQDATTTETQTTEEDTKTPEEIQKELTDRLKARREQFKQSMTSVQKTRLKARCKNSQGLLSSVEGRIKGLATSRNQRYGNLVDRLTKLSSKLNDKGVDTVELNAQIEVLKAKIEAFKTYLVNYEQVVAKLATMDCQETPEAFKASLEEAKALRQTLRASEKDIKTFMKETLKPLLVDIRKNLVTKVDDNNNGGGEN